VDVLRTPGCQIFRFLLIQSVSAGVDYFPLKELKENKITLTSASGINSNRNALMVLTYILMDTQGVQQSIVNRQYERWKEPSALADLTEKSYLIFGTGNLGKSVASVLNSHGATKIWGLIQAVRCPPKVFL